MQLGKDFQESKVNKKAIRLVVDANIIFSALVKDSTTRKLIIEAPIYFYTPDILIEEINRNLNVISKKTGLKVSTISPYLTQLKRKRLIEESMRPKRLIDSFVIDLEALEK